MLASRGSTALLTLALALPAQGEGTVPSAGDARARAAELLAERDCQTSLPEVPSAAPGEASANGGDGLTRRPLLRPGDGGDRGASLPAGSSGFSIAEPVLWIAVALAVAWLLAAIVRGLRLGGPAPSSEEEPKEGRPQADAPPPAEQLADHARLAAAGEITAAVRALLISAFTHLARRTGALPAHATGRELLQLARARDAALANDDLAALVRLVEVLHFGGRPADPRHYDESLGHYERWRQACAAAR